MPQPYRILLVNSLLTQGGTERQVAVVAQSLSRERFEVTVAANRPGGMRADELAARGIPIHYYPLTSYKSPSTFVQGMRLARLIREQRIDLVHTFDVPGTVFGAPFAWLAKMGLAKLGSRRPVVLTSQRAHRNLTPGLMTHLMRMTDRLSAGNVVNCEAMRQHLLEEGVAPERIHLCYNAIDVGTFRPAPEPAARPLTIGVICVQRPEKGLRTLVEAFAQVAGLDPTIRLRFVGNGAEQPGLIALAQERGVGARVEFLPAASNVAPHYREIDIFVLPSLSEALSNSLMEASASGCCPVASRVGGNPEIIDEGKTGLLFSAGDAAALAQTLRQLIENPAQRQAYASAARKRMVELFSTEASMKRMEEIYLNHLRS